MWVEREGGSEKQFRERERERFVPCLDQNATYDVSRTWYIRK